MKSCNNKPCQLQKLVSQQHLTPELQFSLQPTQCTEDTTNNNLHIKTSTCPLPCYQDLILFSSSLIKLKETEIFNLLNILAVCIKKREPQLKMFMIATSSEHTLHWLKNLNRSSVNLFINNWSINTLRSESNKAIWVNKAKTTQLQEAYWHWSDCVKRRYDYWWYSRQNWDFLMR